MSNFEVIKDIKGKEHLVFDNSELYDKTQVGNKFEDFEVLQKLGQGNFGEVFKVLSKINNRVYAMKKINLQKIKTDYEERYRFDLELAESSGNAEEINKIKKAMDDPIRLALNETEYLKKLNNPHIIKYYNNFKEDGYLYIIIEYARNGDLEKINETNKELDKHLQEEQLWNIFLQCMEALSYIHSTGAIHRDIKPANLFLDNNMTIKVGDFGVSAVKNKDENNNYINAQYIFFKNKKMECTGTYVGSGPYMAKEIIEQNEYDQKVDVYSMGATFFTMCFFETPAEKLQSINVSKEKIIKLIERENQTVHYSKELLDIIVLMLENDKNKRKTSDEILNMITTQFSKKYVKNTSIESIVRCLYSFTPLTDIFINFNQNEIIDKPVGKAYIQCLKSITQPSLDAWINSINYFRQVLAKENPKFQGAREIEPRFVFAILIEKLHKEFNQYSQKFKNKEKEEEQKYLIISGEEESKTSKLEMLLKFVNEFSANFDSFVSERFLGYYKSKYICNKCNMATYSFSSFFFVTFNLENILKNNYNNISILNIEQQFINQNNTMQIKDNYCSKCLNKTEHNCFKQFYSVPQLLIISIQRGKNYYYKIPINISERLDLSGGVELPYCKKQFNLVGLLARIDNNGNESFYSVRKYNECWYKCEGNNINQIQFPSNSNLNGDILMMFYM